MQTLLIVLSWMYTDYMYLLIHVLYTCMHHAIYISMPSCHLPMVSVVSSLGRKYKRRTVRRGKLS